MKVFFELLEELEPMGILALAKALSVNVVERCAADEVGGNNSVTDKVTELGDEDLKCGELSTYRTSSDGEKTLRDTRASAIAENEPLEVPPMQGHSAASHDFIRLRDGKDVIADIITQYCALSRIQRRIIDRDLKTIVKRQRSRK